MSDSQHRDRPDSGPNDAQDPDMLCPEARRRAAQQS